MSGLIRSSRTARRCSAATPLISRSIAKTSSMRRTAPTASGDLPRSASTKNLRRPWLQQAASVIGDRAGPAPGIVEIAKAGISIGLEDPGIAGEMPVGVLAVAIARVEEQRCGRVGTGERPIVPDISPYPANDSLAFGEHRHGGVVAVQTFGGEHVPADQF